MSYCDLARQCTSASSVVDAPRPQVSTQPREHLGFERHHMPQIQASTLSRAHPDDPRYASASCASWLHTTSTHPDLACCRYFLTSRPQVRLDDPERISASRDVDTRQPHMSVHLGFTRRRHIIHTSQPHVSSMLLDFAASGASRQPRTHPSFTQRRHISTSSASRQPCMHPGFARRRRISTSCVRIPQSHPCMSSPHLSLKCRRNTRRTSASHVEGVSHPQASTLSWAHPNDPGHALASLASCLHTTSMHLDLAWPLIIKHVLF